MEGLVLIITPGRKAQLRAVGILATFVMIVVVLVLLERCSA